MNANLFWNLVNNAQTFYANRQIADARDTLEAQAQQINQMASAQAEERQRLEAQRGLRDFAWQIDRQLDSLFTLLESPYSDGQERHRFLADGFMFAEGFFGVLSSNGIDHRVFDDIDDKRFLEEVVARAHEFRDAVTNELGEEQVESLSAYQENLELLPALQDVVELSCLKSEYPSYPRTYRIALVGFVIIWISIFSLYFYPALAANAARTDASLGGLAMSVFGLPASVLAGVAIFVIVYQVGNHERWNEVAEDGKWLKKFSKNNRARVLAHQSEGKVDADLHSARMKLRGLGYDVNVSLEEMKTDLQRRSRWIDEVTQYYRLPQILECDE